MSLATGTHALTGTPAIFNDTEERLTGLTQSRDVLADQIKRVLDKAEFQGTVNAKQIASLTTEAEQFLSFATQELAQMQ
jgi:hypothetical protein